MYIKLFSLLFVLWRSLKSKGKKDIMSYAPWMNVVSVPSKTGVAKLLQGAVGV